jgi:hypothetical protein
MNHTSRSAIRRASLGTRSEPVKACISCGSRSAVRSASLGTTVVLENARSAVPTRVSRNQVAGNEGRRASRSAVRRASLGTGHATSASLRARDSLEARFGAHLSEPMAGVLFRSFRHLSKRGPARVSRNPCHVVPSPKKKTRSDVLIGTTLDLEKSVVRHVESFPELNGRLRNSRERKNSRQPSRSNATGVMT